MDRTAHVKHLLLVCQVLFLSFSIFSCSQEKQEKPDIFTIGTGGSLGNYDAAGRAIARIVNKKQETHGFLLQEKNTTGSVYNIDAIMKDEIEFGIAQADRQYQAINGLAEWKGRGPQKDLRAVFGLYTESVTLVATRDSGIKTIEDLRGKRVDIGHPGSGLRKNAIDALAAAGIDWRKDIKAYEEKPDDRTSMYLHGELDAYFDTIGHPSTSMVFAVNSVPGVRFIPLVNLDKLLSKYPYYSKSIIPVELYPGVANKEDVDTFGVKATFLTSANIRDDVVYAITKAIFEEFESLGEFNPILNTFRKERVLEGLTAPIHSGALRYYKEIGLQVPQSVDRQVNLELKSAAGGAVALSGTGALIKRDISPTEYAVSGSQVTLTWEDTSSNELGFKIERKKGSGGFYREIATVGENVSTYTDTRLTPDTTYYYRVRAFNSLGHSAYSAEIRIKTSAQ